MTSALLETRTPVRTLSSQSFQDDLRAEVKVLLTTGDIAAGEARIVAAGGAPATFVIGPTFDSAWLRLSWHVSAHFDGTYMVGSGKTMDAAVTNLLAKAAVVRPAQIAMTLEAA